MKILVSVITLSIFLNLGAQPVVTDTAKATSRIASPTFASMINHDGHILRKGDSITFTIHQDPFAQKQGPIKLIVSELGVRFPITHDPKNLSLRIPVAVVNRSIRDVKEELTKRLIKDYYNRVTLEIFVEERAARIGKVRIFDNKGGSLVNTEISFNLAEPPRLTEALAKASFKDEEWVDKKEVLLLRYGQDGQLKSTTQVRWRDAMSGKVADPILQDKDRIQVKEKGGLF